MDKPKIPPSLVNQNIGLTVSGFRETLPPCAGPRYFNKKFCRCTQHAAADDDGSGVSTQTLHFRTETEAASSAYSGNPIEKPSVQPL
ncbi:hypothetical protein DPMN_001774 [Dreissena polymorpha]|uniref:Uncharacterized protein n=1 Tax=Dreissena polymorpha TaxID=45954 RepID=A0A9D4MKY2_DREPO|nr:hypothetical protein DPMN_001774 [Dreissena polymorpha]